MLTNLKANFNQLWKYVAAGGTVLAYQALYDRIKSKSALSEHKNDINIIKTDVKEVKELVTQNMTDESIKKSLVERIEPINDCIKDMEDLYKSTGTKIQDHFNSSNKQLSQQQIDRIMESYNQEMGKLISKSINKLSELEKFLEDNGLNKKLFEDNFITNLIKDFKDYLSTLSIEQLCILIDFLLITLVLSCLITILIAFYGNFLIDKFSLEEKYPKLSGIIKLRRKFQHYYIISNSLIIIIALIFMGYVNLLTLLNAS